MITSFENILSEPTCKPYFEDVIVKIASNSITKDFLSSLNDFFLAICGVSLMMNNDYYIRINNQNNIQKTTFASEITGFTDITTSIVVENKPALRTFTLSYTTQAETITFSFGKNKVQELSGNISLKTFFLLAFNQVVYNYLEIGILDLNISSSSLLKH